MKLIASCFSVGVHSAARELVYLFKDSHLLDELFEMPLAEMQPYDSFKLFLVKLGEIVYQVDADAKI